MSGCGTIFGGHINDCQKYPPNQGETKRKIRAAALIGDMLFPVITFPIDFSSGGIYAPCETPRIINDSLKNLYKQLGQLTISGGIGVSAIQLEILYLLSNGYWNNNNNPAYEEGPNWVYLSPPYNFSADYRISQRSSVGAAVCYQYVTDLPYIAVDPTQQVEKISRLNIALRYLCNITNPRNTKFEYKLGCRIGLSFWKDIIPQGMNPDYSFLEPPDFYNYYIKDLSKSSLIFTSIQILQVISYYPFGGDNIKSYFLNNIGLNIEEGLGTPYWIEGGLSFRFGKKKETKPESGQK